MYSWLSGISARPSHLQLFPMPNVADPEDLLLSQDVIFVGGGSVANLMAVWRVHGLDAIMRQAWQQGTVLAGVSAGALCWFEGGTTDSFGPALRPFTAEMCIRDSGRPPGPGRCGGPPRRSAAGRPAAAARMRCRACPPDRAPVRWQAPGTASR